MRIGFKSIVLFFFCILKGNAQQVVTLEEAIKIALENNFDIQLAKNDLKAAETNRTAGNAGMLPQLTAAISQNNNLQKLSQTRSDGSKASLANAKNNSLNYGLALNWTLFDGFKMFAKKDQLKELHKLNENQLKWEVITKLSAVQVAYYNLVQQQQQLAALDSTIVISNQRLSLAQNRFTIGKASKLEVLNAQVDTNADKVSLLRQQELYKVSKIALNQLLGRTTPTDFIVVANFTMENKLDYENLKTAIAKQNPQLQALLISKKVSELDLKQVKSGRYPTIAINTGYNFANSQSSLGFLTQSSARGFNYGFSASLNLFDGLNQRRNEKIAAISIDKAAIKIEQQSLALNSQLDSLYQSYLTNLELLQLETSNVGIAKQNLDITLDKFRIGTISPIEFRTAQLNYVNAKVRYSETQLQTKLSEIALKELAGNMQF